MTNKTLIGKHNYLFLINDSANEIKVHHNNLCIVKDDFYNNYINIINKYLLIVFPNKSYVYKHLLPDEYNLKYRPNFDKYKEKLGNHILDIYPYIINKDTFYKTDTHMNLNGSYITYLNTIDKINELFNLNLNKIVVNILNKQCILPELGLGLGDLLWISNLGNQTIIDNTDTYYYSPDITQIYIKYTININSNIQLLTYDLVNKTNEHNGKILDWIIISNYIIYVENININNNYKVLIFYDSFLTSTLGLWFKTFSKAFFVKTIFNTKLVETIKPDYVFEFRVERFLI